MPHRVRGTPVTMACVPGAAQHLGVEDARKALMVVRCRPGTVTIEALVGNFLSEVAPFRVQLINEIKFPGTSPTFKTALTGARFDDGGKFLEINKTSHSIGTGEAR